MSRLLIQHSLNQIADLRKYSGHQDDLFGSVSEENVEGKGH